MVKCTSLTAIARFALAEWMTVAGTDGATTIATQETADVVVTGIVAADAAEMTIATLEIAVADVTGIADGTMIAGVTGTVDATVDVDATM